MKRAGGLWEKLISFANLQEAARRAALGKRQRPDVAAFLLEQETELVRLQHDLERGEYRPGPYRQFLVREPKPRMISAASFRDRVVHHALTQRLEPVFERRFSKDSFACRKGFGTHRALERAAKAAARFPYVLKRDVRKYFPSIDHEILKYRPYTLVCSELDDILYVVDRRGPSPDVLRLSGQEKEVFEFCTVPHTNDSRAACISPSDWRVARPVLSGAHRKANPARATARKRRRLVVYAGPASGGRVL